MSKASLASIDPTLRAVSALKLPASTLRVFLAWFANHVNYHPTRKQLAERTNLNRVQVSRALRQLCEAGILREINGDFELGFQCDFHGDQVHVKVNNFLSVDGNNELRPSTQRNSAHE